MVTPKRVHEHIDFLNFLKTCNAPQRNAAIKYANKEEILALVECCINTLRGNVYFTDDEKNHLKKHRNSIRRVAQKIPLARRRKILVQKGGFLPILLAPLLSILSSVAGAAISRAIK